MHRFASKVNLHQRIHQILPVAIKAKNLPHPIHEGIVHFRQRSILGIFIHFFFSSLSNVHRITTETHSVAGLQLWRSSGWTRLLSKTDLQASTGLILYPLYPPHTHVYQPAITLKYKYSLVIMSCTEKHNHVKIEQLMLLDWPHSLLGLFCKRVWNSPVAHLQLLRQTSWPSGSLWPQQRGRQGHKAEATSSRSSALKRGEEERGLKPEACKFRINKSSFDTRQEKLFTVILSHTKPDIMTPSCNPWSMWQKTLAFWLAWTKKWSWFSKYYIQSSPWIPI